MTKYVYGLKERILTDESYLHKIYDFAFSFSLEEKQKKLPRELAVSYWRLLLSDRFGGEVLEKWCKFITDSWDSDIHKDQWLMAFPFLKEYNDNPKFEGYDETAAWPLLMDSFVENETGA
ncbi:unnamed protein product [Kuraishia capsulata CBS 1993]|uniref:Defective in cullin neddylation protein n=1 Tax=Kuraishia capsulata CBS 1993 TaxID=1382522 RepID=W6MQA6_9ASCO|nr:uncharacterized protein KUCA_T00004861001 [Kuraishia capsulata CBS 1993]CDK28876.1 unnamed protein product [Kuraishia capsulata CBS 1993]